MYLIGRTFFDTPAFSHIDDAVRTKTVEEYDEIWITFEEPEIDSVNREDWWNKDRGFIQFNLPRLDENRLYLANFGCKTDWWNSETGESGENIALAKAYIRLKRVLRKNLATPVWIRHPDDVKSIPTKMVSYSVGAAEWEEAGVQLRQEGSLILFSTNDISSNK